MYAAGAPHPHKAPSVAWLRRVAAGELAAATDAEVLQEVLHRYRSIDRWDDGCRVYDLARRVVPMVLPVTVDTLDGARELMDSDSRLSARDAIHAAAAIANGCHAICTYDRAFDRITGLTRIEP
ncbi:MAG: type II toxin-antitoxin system VapC family toxin [Geminicoccaceae bacterium]|jgi:predicted nucleic acid-binding protein|nr:type II toxin-antitoxin system VapC family toxin [Geminicoccaceae bacterium]